MGQFMIKMAKVKDGALYIIMQLHTQPNYPVENVKSAGRDI